MLPRGVKFLGIPRVIRNTREAHEQAFLESVLIHVRISSAVIWDSRSACRRNAAHG